MTTIRAAAVQMEHAAGDKEKNFAKIERFVIKAVRSGVKMLVFPECCITGYWHLRKLSREGLEAIAERVPEGPSTVRLVGLAREHGMTIGAGLVEKTSDGRMFNTYVVAMANGEVRRHRKIQAFEHDAISCGEEFTVFETPEGVKVGVLICYDNNIVENVRITALKGAQVLMAPHQTGGCASISPHGMKPINREIWANRVAKPEAAKREVTGDKGRAWLMRWLPSRAHDNGIFLVFANGIGVDDDEIRTGNAMVLDPYGRIVAENNELADAMVVADLDLGLIELSTGQRWMQSRRPELYGPLTVPTGRERTTREVRMGRNNK